MGSSAAGRERSDRRRDNYSFFLLRLRVAPRRTAIVPLPISPARRSGVPALANYANSREALRWRRAADAAWPSNSGPSHAKGVLEDYEPTLPPQASGPNSPHGSRSPSQKRLNRSVAEVSPGLCGSNLLQGIGECSSLGAHDQSPTIVSGSKSCSANLQLASRHEQPEKSISFTGTVVPASAFSVLLLASWLVIINEGTQSEEPPLSGTAAFARTLYSTSVAAGIE